MKPTKQLVCVSASPHDHNYETGGPIDIQLAVKYQPKIVAAHPSKATIKFWVSQPDERTNFTLIHLMFGTGYPAPAEGRHYSLRVWRLRRNTLELYIKRRVYDSVPHPWPLGRYHGTCESTDRWAIFTLQHRTLRVKAVEPQRRIIIPGEEDRP